MGAVSAIWSGRRAGCAGRHLILARPLDADATRVARGRSRRTQPRGSMPSVSGQHELFNEAGQDARQQPARCLRRRALLRMQRKRAGLASNVTAGGCDKRTALGESRDPRMDGIANWLSSIATTHSPSPALRAAYALVRLGASQAASFTGRTLDALERFWWAPVQAWRWVACASRPAWLGA